MSKKVTITFQIGGVKNSNYGYFSLEVDRPAKKLSVRQMMRLVEDRLNIERIYEESNGEMNSYMVEIQGYAGSYDNTGCKLGNEKQMNMSIPLKGITKEENMAELRRILEI